VAAKHIAAREVHNYQSASAG